MADPDQDRPGRPGQPGQPDGGLPSRVTTPLLTLITQQSLDEDYRVAAERRQDGTPPPRARHLAALVVAGFGVLLSVAFVQTAANADVESAGRTTLVERVDAQRDRLDDVQRDIADLRDAVAQLGRQATELAEQDQANDPPLQRLQVRAGFVPVRGPGVRVVVDDGDQPGEDVRDPDLVLLVNGLWSAGAEAVSVNGQRLTARSAITTSGGSIEVNSIGVAAPYVVLAIGDPDGMWARFFDTPSGLAFDDASRQFGFGYEVEDDDSLVLPAAPPRLEALSEAQTVTEDVDGPLQEKGGETP